MRSKGVSANAATTLWTDVIVKFGLLVRRGKYTHQDKLAAYLKNLAGYLVLNHFRDLRRKIPDDWQPEEIIALQHHTFTSIELRNLLDQQLARLGDLCRQVLELWSMGSSMREIQSQLKIISETATRKRKHDCLKRLYSNVQSNPQLKELFNDYLVNNE